MKRINKSLWLYLQSCWAEGGAGCPPLPPQARTTARRPTRAAACWPAPPGPPSSRRTDPHSATLHCTHPRMLTGTGSPTARAAATTSGWPGPGSRQGEPSPATGPAPPSPGQAASSSRWAAPGRPSRTTTHLIYRAYFSILHCHH